MTQPPTDDRSADMTDIDCPRAKTWMTPCIARDGHTALADDGVCVGCGIRPHSALKDLAERHPPARAYLQTRDPKVLADRLTEQVVEYING